MALFFTCGGGRLGNQLLNLIHLTALYYEYNLKIIKLVDLFITSRQRSFTFKIDKNNNWKLVEGSLKNSFCYKLTFKIFICVIHAYFYISPKKKSFKIGNYRNIPKFILGKKLDSDFSLEYILNLSNQENVALCGWGFRDWDLVLRHKEKIIQNLIQGFQNTIEIKTLKTNKYLLVQIRRGDFLKVKDFKDLNFESEVWVKSILKVCTNYSLKEVVLFSDELIDDLIISSLLNNGIRVITPNTENNFFCNFVNYIYNASLVMCNASTLTLSISFLFHEKIYLPSKINDFQEILINEAHNTMPCLLNWN